MKLIRIIIACIFLLWIIPLGVFIKPVNEKELCGGKRAICLCTHMTAKDASAGIDVTFSPAPAKSESSSCAYPFLVLNPAKNSDQACAKIFVSSQVRYSHVFSSSLEHVPKA